MSSVRLSFSVRAPWHWVFLESLVASSSSSEDQPNTSTRRSFPNRQLLLKSEPALEEYVADKKLRQQLKQTRGSTANFVVVHDGGVAEKSESDESSPPDVLVILGDSCVFDNLDDKDLFVITMTKFDLLGSAVPPSLLLPEDFCDVAVAHQHDETSSSSSSFSKTLFPSVPAVLKSPLGSGGDSVFFVWSVNDILALLQQDAERAKADPSFMKYLFDTKGRIPRWVLQSEIKSLPIFQNRKFHMRSYVLVIEREGEDEDEEKQKYKASPHVFLYTRNHEVRVAARPMRVTMNGVVKKEDENQDGEEDDNIDERDRRAHITNGARGSETVRLLLDDVDQLAGVRPRLEKFVADIFGAKLLPEYSERIRSQQQQRELLHDDRDNGETRRRNKNIREKKFAFAGIDIMLTPSGEFQILEVNANPAAPPASAFDFEDSDNNNDDNCNNNNNNNNNSIASLFGGGGGGGADSGRKKMLRFRTHLLQLVRDLTAQVQDETKSDCGFVKCA